MSSILLSKRRRQRTATVVHLSTQAPRTASEPVADAAVLEWPRPYRDCDCAGHDCVHELQRRKLIARQKQIRALAREVGMRNGTLAPESEPHYSHGMAMPGGWTFCQTYDIRCHCDSRAADACRRAVDRYHL